MDFRKINRIWQCLTLILAPVILTLLIIYKSAMSPWTWLLWLHLPLLMIHEAEEYVFAPMDFVTFANLKTFIGSGTDPDKPVGPDYCFQVNVGTFWPLIIISALLSRAAPWLGMSLIWVQIILNNLMHTIGFQGRKPGYNPGLITNCVLLVPYCVVMIVNAAGFFRWYDWALSAVIGFGLWISMFLKTMRLRKAARAEAKAEG